MVSVLVPAGYLLFLCTSLWAFSKVYRKQSAIKPAFVPWFKQQKARDVYISLLSLEPPAPRPILIAALLRRAMEDVRLIWQIRDSKAALAQLLQKGQVGDDLWERFLLAEKELEVEIVEVVGEANTFQEGYGTQIFGIASDMVSHEKWKDIYLDLPNARKIALERAAAGPASSVLAPLSYLTPSSLTLAPSNPIPPTVIATKLEIEATPAPVEVIAPVTPIPAISLPPPIPSNVLPNAPPSPSPQESDDEDQSPPSTVPGSPTSVKSTSTPSKNKKKKKKSGGK